MAFDAVLRAYVTVQSAVTADFPFNVMPHRGVNPNFVGDGTVNSNVYSEGSPNSTTLASVMQMAGQTFDSDAGNTTWGASNNNNSYANSSYITRDLGIPNDEFKNPLWYEYDCGVSVGSIRATTVQFKHAFNGNNGTMYSTMSGNYPKDYMLQGSNDGFIWNNIAGETGLPMDSTGWQSGVIRSFKVDNPIWYSRYRVIVTAWNHPQYVSGAFNVCWYIPCVRMFGTTLAVPAVNFNAVVNESFDAFVSIATTNLPETAIGVYDAAMTLAPVVTNMYVSTPSGIFNGNMTLAPVEFAALLSRDYATEASFRVNLDASVLVGQLFDFTGTLQPVSSEIVCRNVAVNASFDNLVNVKGLALVGNVFALRGTCRFPEMAGDGAVPIVYTLKSELRWSGQGSMSSATGCSLAGNVRIDAHATATSGEVFGFHGTLKPVKFAAKVRRATSYSFAGTTAPVHFVGRG